MSQQQSYFLKCSLSLFCGCQLLSEVQENTIPFKLFFCIGFIFLASVVTARLGTGWFVYKDYYPLKQRSPILCLIMLSVISIKIQLYPIMYIYNFFGNSFESYGWIYRILWYSLKGIAEFTYFIRSMRIIYAHETHPSRSKTKIFKLFKNEFMLGAIVIIVIILRAIPIYVADSNQQIPLYTPIEFINPFRDMQEDQSDYMVKMLLSEVLWQLILIYCYWLQYYVNSKYTISRQILTVIVSRIILSLMGLIYLGIPPDEEGSRSQDIFRNLCRLYEFYPIIQLYQICSILIMLIVTIIVPLTGRKIYHMLLPTGREYGLIKTMRDFLLQQEFLKVFQHYLHHIDTKNNNKDYFLILTFWKRLIVLKYNLKTPELKKLNEIRKILENVQSILFSNQSQLVVNLKSSIIELENTMGKKVSEISNLSNSINQKIDELQAIAIQKLDLIYKSQFSKTRSYHYLKQKINIYKRININMILLNLAIITDSVQQES